MELKLNMYYRTYSGFINKIISIKDYNEREYLLNGFYINKKDTIKKASYDIIDILEVGDYVNGSKVVEVDFDAEEEKYIRIDKAHDGLKTILRNNDIKSMVTKEQFENMEYRIGE